MEVLEFLKDIRPFNLLKSYDLEQLSKSVDILYYKQDDTILKPKTKAEYLYFVLKGVVQEYSDSEAVSIYTNKEFFDAKALIENRVKNSFKAKEETICYALKREVFLEYLYNYQELEHYFFSSIAQKLSQNIQNENSKKFVDFTVAKVEDAYIQKPIFIDASSSIKDALLKVKEHNIDALFVKRGDSFGIVTDYDFVIKAMLGELSYSQSVESIATFNLIGVQKSDYLFNAHLKLTKEGIKKLAVFDNSKLIGFIDAVSINSFFATFSYSIIKLVDDAKDTKELQEASKKYIKTIQNLYDKGIKVRYIAKLISMLNEKIFNKAFELLAPNSLKDNCTLIVMGSEGRGEQIFRTDQDNALIVDDKADINKSELESFTKNFSALLIKCGYPPCPGNIMLSNPYWCDTIKGYEQKILEWITNPSEDNAIYLSIFYDAKAVVGSSEVLERLKSYMLKIMGSYSSFYGHFAKPILYFDTPLGVFRDFVVEKNEHKNELDIKKGGVFAIVHGVRALALEQKLLQTNTVERIKELNNLNIIDREFASELIEAFSFMLRLRLRFNLEKISLNQEANNYINPQKLTLLERDLLKDSFKIVNRFKKFVSYHFKLNLIS